MFTTCVRSFVVGDSIEVTTILQSAPHGLVIVQRQQHPSGLLLAATARNRGMLHGVPDFGRTTPVVLSISKSGQSAVINGSIIEIAVAGSSDAGASTFSLR